MRRRHAGRRPGLKEGPPLWTLAAVATATALAVMGAVSFWQFSLERATEERTRSGLLVESLAPLAQSLKSAATPAEAARAVRRHHDALVALGRGHHGVALLDHQGRTLVSAGPEGSGGAGVRAQLPVDVPFLRPARGLLVVTERPDKLAGDARRRRTMWLAHFVVTAAALAAAISLAVYLLALRPIRLLLAQIERAERGYWDHAFEPGGAREVRRLARRFNALGRELRRTTERLIVAERRGAAAATGPVAAGQPAEEAGPGAAEEVPDHLAAQLARVERQCRTLEESPAGGPEAERIARELWAEGALLAERAGRVDLRARAENAALRILSPPGYRELVEQLERDGARLHDLLARFVRDLRARLDEQAVPVLVIESRVKHAAGVWRKMQRLDLRADQVHDLLGVRIVVSTEEACYRALAAVHRHFDPLIERFKDYIANPKSNGYQSLHTTVRYGGESTIEVQIRSLSMHVVAERGKASHIVYKQGQAQAS